MEQSTIRASFDRCEAAGDFAERFYEVFLNSSPEIAPLFAKTDFKQQRKLLRASVYIMVTRDVDDPTAHDMLERIGHSHARAKLNIRPDLYALWLDSLCETVKGMDSEWTPALEQSWRDDMAPGIALITSLY